MEIRNIKTNLKKSINMKSFSANELNKIYAFYSTHTEFEVIIDGEVD